MQPYYQHGDISIYCGDCRDILPRLDPHCVDLAIADPPYNVGLEYIGHNDNMSREKYIAWCGDWFSALRKICYRTIIFPGHGNLPVWWQVSKPSAVGCWHKPGNGRSSIIGFEDWEPWLYWTGDKGMLGGSSVVRAVTGSSNTVSGHPCPKPIELITKLLKKCKSGGVIDPFVGSGTTLIAAKRLGIRAIGIEIEERYCEIAAKRLSQEVFDFPTEPCTSEVSSGVSTARENEGV